MRRVLRALPVTAAFAVMMTLPAVAQKPIMEDLMTDVNQVEEKLMGLARAMPAETYDWRPGEGVRSVGEVFQHIAADNYFLPTAFGVMAPAGTNIKAGDYKSGVAYETRKISRDAIIADLQASFTFLKEAMKKSKPSALGETISMFGQTFTGQQWWVLTVTHLHEHLGQAIAYARSNDVVPPWSRGGM